jgi:ferredoxin
MKRWKTVLVALISLWLPVQGYGAIAMPFCQQHGMAKAETAYPAGTSQEHHDAHPGHMAHHASPNDAAEIGLSEPGGEDVTSGLACNNCGACHLACSPAIPAIAPVAALIGEPVLDSSRADSPRFFYPEQLQRPPLSALL